MRPVHFPIPRPGRQRGAVLVTSMLLLMVLTIIGVTVMQMSRMQERLAGNSRDVNMAFQAAEGALRNAERFIEVQKTKPIGCSSAGCQVWLEEAAVGVANADETWWEENGQEFELKTMEGLDEPPKVAVEELGYVRTDGGVVMGQETPDGRDFYQITARSTGGSGQTEVVLQSTYAKKY